MTKGRFWTEEETILVYYYYTLNRNSSFNASQQLVINIANLIDRTPASISQKMANFIHIDPTNKGKGLNHPFQA